MTERQLSLKDEIIKISDILQLGIFRDDPDWFYKFVQRMDVTTQTDSITKASGWTSLLYINIDVSYDFLIEFKNKAPVYSKFLSHPKTYADYGLSTDDAYLCGNRYYQVIRLSKDKNLSVEKILKYEKLFDQTYGRCGNNAVPYIEETAWKHILENKSLDLNGMFLNKPISNVDKKGNYIKK